MITNARVLVSIPACHRCHKVDCPDRGSTHRVVDGSRFFNVVLDGMDICTGKNSVHLENLKLYSRKFRNAGVNIEVELSAQGLIFLSSTWDDASNNE